MVLAEDLLLGWREYFGLVVLRAHDRLWLALDLTAEAASAGGPSDGCRFAAAGFGVTISSPAGPADGDFVFLATAY